MDTDNSQKILQFLEEHGPSSTAQVAAHLGITTQGAHKRLKKFIESKQVEQTGIHPNIVYRLAQAPVAQQSTPTQRTKGDSQEDLARRADDLAYRTLGWELYARGKTLIQGVLLGRDALTGKVIPKRWVMGGLVVLVGWLVIQYIWIPLRQGELARTQQELAQSKQLLAESQNTFQQQLARVQNELATTKAQLAKLQQQQLQSTLTGDHLTMNQIVALTQAGIPSDEIIDRIKAAHYVYGLTASDLAWLRQHGVAEEVIQAMQATSTTGSADTTTNPSSSGVQSQVVNKVWGWVQNKINGL